MSEDTTQERPDARSFEERVFARFDAMEARFDSVDARLINHEARFDAMEAHLIMLEERVDARAYETRPIWEAVLSRLDGIDNEMKVINRRVRLLHDDILRTREEQEDLRERVTKLEPEQSH
jgi:predicted  nucleic acid-binding Zn-ribbon protein